MKFLKKMLCGVVLAAMAISASAATFVGSRDDFRDETIYFAMTTRFYDGDPTNNVLSWDKQDVQIANNDPDWRGDFAGLIEKLDYIKALGFTAIWITPITQNASGEDYHGYHSMDFSSVDLRYESRKEWGASKDVKFQDLIDAAHKKGMKIILDIVLNHTSNFGEATLNPLFTRDQNIRNQASPATALIPNPDRFSANYFEQDGNAQYNERFKYFKNPQYDVHNYYHHYGTGWNWDEPNRWWGQIAGDCVDLNTENNTVAEHLVRCYGEFIKMGVDGFRIDTTGHIARLTFNKQFIPQFLALAEQYKSKRADGQAFFMFGECCARYGGVIYRDQHNLSSHFYTWKSETTLLNQYNGTQAFWDTQVLPEGHDSPVGPMILCESEKSFNKNSQNVFMQNGAWHQPDYSEYSGFSVIDFPMHYNFNNASKAIDIAKEGDKYYNDASYNVVYVDSHDYSPQPNDQIRFNGGTAQWAENLSLMFTFRGIPCIYYGSEVEFMAGKPIDVGGENNKTPRKESGRAYFGHYLEGSVSASDFGVYTASGNVNTTLNGDLSQHIRRLNLIRAAVPALRKGQYTFDGCSASGGWAFKRAYNKNGVDSYALVAINGGATFTNVPSGTYVDLVTGQSYTPSNGTITVSAPTNQGQLRVLVKGWTGGKVGQDGKFIYASTPGATGGSPKFTDPGTKQYYTKDDAVQPASVTFSPAGGTFRTATLSVTATLNSEAVSGWYKVGSAAKVNLSSSNKTATFTIGSDMSFGQSVTVTWGATNSSGDERTGSVTYKKVDPNQSITIFCKASSAPNLYAWIPNTETALNGSWPGNKMTSKETVQGVEYWTATFQQEAVNIIFNNGSAQTADITNITDDTYFTYDGGSSYTVVTDPANPDSGNTDQPVDGKYFVYFNNTSNWDVRVWAWNGSTNCCNNSSWPGDAMTATGDGRLYWEAKAGTAPTQIIFSNNGNNQTADLTFVNGATYTPDGKYTTDDTPSQPDPTPDPTPAPTDEFTIYFDNSVANWAQVYAYVWDYVSNTEILGAWPGKQLSTDPATGHFVCSFKTTYADPRLKVVFTNNSGDQTDDLFLENYAIYNYQGKQGEAPEMGVEDNLAPDNDFTVWTHAGTLYIRTDSAADMMLYRIDGTAIPVHLEPGLNIFDGLPRGFYIFNRTKIII